MPERRPLTVTPRTGSRARRRVGGFVALAVVAGSASLAALAPPDPAAAAGRKKADLVISSVPSPASLVAGGSTRVRVETRNAGRRAAPASTSTMWLSSDRTKSRSDLEVGSRAVDRLRPGRTVTSRIPVRIPAATSVGQYFLVVCADARKKVRESKEGNNCRASRPVSVTGATPPPTTPSGSTPSQEVIDELTRAAGPLWSWEAQPSGTRSAPITVDESRTTSATLGPAGGTLTVSTASGDSMTLTVPSGALVDDVPIEATPVTAVEGDAAVGARAVGLRLAPEGLTLLRPATLDVTPAGGVDREAVGIAGLDDGTGTGPALLMPDVDRLAMPVHHFSHHTVLVADGESGFTAQYLTDAEYTATIRDRIVQMLTDERNAQLAGEPEDPDVWVEVRRLLDDYFAEVIVPLVERATSDCGFAEARFHEAIAFTRQQAMSGEEDTAQQRLVFDGFDAATRNCWEELTAECLPMDGVRFRKLLALARQAELMGTTLGDGGATDPFEQVEWCGTMHGWIDGEETFDFAEDGVTEHDESTWRIWITAEPYVAVDGAGRLLWVDAATSQTVGSRYQGSGAGYLTDEDIDCTSRTEYAWHQPPAAFEGTVAVPHFQIRFTDTGADPAPQPISSSYVYGGSRGVDHEVTESDCRGSEVYETSSRFGFQGQAGKDMTLTWDPERLAFDLSKIVLDEHSTYRATGSLFLSPAALESP